MLSGRQESPNPPGCHDRRVAVLSGRITAISEKWYVFGLPMFDHVSKNLKYVSEFMKLYLANALWNQGSSLNKDRISSAES